MPSETTPGFSHSVQENEIRMQRSEILDDIYSAYGTSELHHQGTKALNQEWNELPDHQEGSHSGTTMDPLLFLPAELWIDIVREATKGIGMAGPPTDALLLLTLVSSDWRTNLMGTPGLWTDITIGKGEADAQAKLETVLWLSQNLHFTLRVEVPSLQWSEALPLFQLHAHRIKEIVLTVFPERGDPDLKKATEFLQNFFPSLGHLPALQAIEGVLLADWHDIATRAPNLRHVHRSSVSLEIVRSLALRTCTIETQSSEVLQNLGDMSHVEELSWGVDEDREAYSGIFPLPSMPALKQIHSFQILNNNLLLLLKLAGSLTTLDISIMYNWKHLYDLFNLLEHLPHLEVLELYLHEISEKVALPATMNLCPTRLRDLRIVTFTGEMPSLDALSNLFSIYFPTLQSLSINSVAWDLPLASYIKSLSTLWFLHLSYTPGNFNVSIDSSSLQYLILEDQPEAYLFSLLRNARCSTLSTLKICDVGIGLEGKVVQPPEEANYLHENGTPSIYTTTETLEIGSIQARWEVSKFTALRKLQVGGREVRSSGFLVGLMLEPCSCPALTDIELFFVPEWDLLFLMLEHRNSPFPRNSHSRGIKKIETITLPSPVPRVLLEPLTTLLSGKRSAISTRPSNWDLSFSGFMEKYFDPTITGCERCITSIMACTLPWLKISGFDNRQIFHEIYLPPEQSGVSAGVWEWLQSREDRLSAWKAQEDTWFRRHGMCAEMKLAQRPFSVTGYSLSGKWFHSRLVERLTAWYRLANFAWTCNAILGRGREGQYMGEAIPSSSYSSTPSKFDILLQRSSRAPAHPPTNGLGFGPVCLECPMRVNALY